MSNILEKWIKFKIVSRRLMDFEEPELLNYLK